MISVSLRSVYPWLERGYSFVSQSKSLIDVKQQCERPYSLSLSALMLLTSAWKR